MGFFSCLYFCITSAEGESLSLLELALSSLLFLLAPHPMTVLVVAADMGDKMKQCRWKRVVAKRLVSLVLGGIRLYVPGDKMKQCRWTRVVAK